jgi:CRISPR/Cas system-associated exonuclease Cas4 (RecB family)
MSLRGSVDLVERRAGGGALRITDHKTGAERTDPGLVIGKGEVLQPVLYGLAVEAALALPVTEARLFYCTARGGFTEHTVKLDDRARREGLGVLEIIDGAIANGFLPPAPRDGACGRCDFRAVCGPYEEERWRRKEQAPLAALTALRERP